MIIHHYLLNNGNILAIYNNGATKIIKSKDFTSYFKNNPSMNAEAKEDLTEIKIDLDAKAKKQAEEDEARERCQACAEELEAYTSGNAYICPVCGEVMTADEMEEHEDEDGNTLYTCPHCGANFEEDEAEQASIYDYFKNNDIYNIEYRIDGQNELRSVEIMIACGGPNVYIDTGKNAICLYWWGTSAEYPIDTAAAAAVEEYAREMRGE